MALTIIIFLQPESVTFVAFKVQTKYKQRRVKSQKAPLKEFKENENHSLHMELTDLILTIVPCLGTWCAICARDKHPSERVPDGQSQC